MRDWLQSLLLRVLKKTQQKQKFRQKVTEGENVLKKNSNNNFLNQTKVYCSEREKKETKKKGHVNLTCFTIWFMFKKISTKNQIHQISFCHWFRSKFMIIALVSSKKQFKQWVFCDRGTHKSVWDVSWRINNCSASLTTRAGLGCESSALGWPPTPAGVIETTDMHVLGCSLCLRRVCPAHPHCVSLAINWSGPTRKVERIWTMLLARNCVVWHTAWGLALSCGNSAPYNGWRPK